MLRTRFVFGLSVLFLAGGIVVTAQGQGNAPKTTNKPTAPKAAAPAPHTTTKAAPVKPAQVKTAPPTMKGKSPSPSPASAKTPASKPATTKSASAAPPKVWPAKTVKTDKTPSTVTAKATTKPVKTEKPETKLAKTDKPAKSTKSTTTSSTSTPPLTKTTTTTELTPVQQKLQKNTNLAAKVASRLPQGTDLMTAAAGFKNLGQFVAAANVSNNLQISFTELKAKMMTGMSLGQAIQAVRPLTASPTVEAQRAEYDARGMIADSEPTTSAPSSTGMTPSTTATSTPTSTTPKPKAKTKNSAQ